MANIFLTGVSASYASPEANQRTLSFAGLINKVLKETGNDVTWASPSVLTEKEDFEQYDSVLVGLSALTSLNSNRAYGALNIINKLWGSDKLVIFVDTPNPSKIEVSLTSLISNPESLTKPFFSFRKDFSHVVGDVALRESVMSGVRMLKNEEWGATIYPKLPWKGQGEIKLPPNAKSNISGLNLDAFLIEEMSNPKEIDSRWATDSEKTSWSKSVISSLVMPASLMKSDRKSDDSKVYESISKSWGALISPDNMDGTWWNFRYIQALNAGTPVATKWQESGSIGDSWTVLASNIESSSLERRKILALAQRESYISYTPSKERAVYELIQTLKIKESLWAK